MKTNEIFGIKAPEDRSSGTQAKLKTTESKDSEPQAKLKTPKKECADKKCPFHGNINVKKKSFVGTVVSAKMHNSAVIEWVRKVHIPKYERYTKKKTRIVVHNPECIHAKEGDRVKVYATRPLSKTVHHVIVETQGKEKHYEERKEALEEGKTRSEVKKEKKTEVNASETETKLKKTEPKNSESQDKPKTTESKNSESQDKPKTTEETVEETTTETKEEATEK